MKIISDPRAEVTIRRPTGEVEIITHPKVHYFTPSLFEQMKTVMRAAGRGEPISYRNIPAVIETEESDYYTVCNRCGVLVDTRIAFHQLEWMRAGSLKARVETYYCSSCYRLLSGIGSGEHTELDERASHAHSLEPVDGGRGAGAFGTED